MKKLMLALLIAAALVGPAAAAPTCPQNTWAGTIWLTLGATDFTLSGAMALNTTGTDYFATSSAGNTGGNSPLPSCASAGCAEYQFNVTGADVGYYKIESLVRAQNGGSDSFFVGINGVNDLCAGGGATGSSGAPAIRRWDVDDSSSNYQWRYVTDWDNDNSFAAARVWYLTAGTYTLHFTGRESDCRISQVRLRRLLDVTPPTPTAVPTPPANGTGLCASYYNGMVPGTGLLGSQTDAQINFNWGTGAPTISGVSSPPSNQFSVRWIGQVEFPEAGSWTFYTTTDDGVRLWVNGALVIDHWADQSATEWASSAVAVTAAGKVCLRMEYYDNTGDARAELRWAGGSVAKSLVPQNRLYPNCAGCGLANTPTPTPGPSATPMPNVYGGVPAAKRLLGLEYSPFPEAKQGSVVIYGLDVTFTASAANNVLRNTARWRVVFQALTSTVGGEVQVETRLGSAGETCSTGYLEPSAYGSATDLVLPDRPQNLSTTYAWVDAEVPYTERFDAMGDPRLMPYADLINGAANLNDWQGGYNWFFKNIRNTSAADYQADYTTFLPQATYDRYNGQPNFDVPKLFALWREGVVASRSIYTSMTGYSSYYIGAGGEIGGDSANKLSSGGVPCYGGPWNGTTSAGRDEIIGSASYVRTATWASRPYMGELWPDSLYASDWYSGGGNATWGNLRNSKQGGSAYREALETIGADTSVKIAYPQVRHRNAEKGCSTFLNGNGGASQFNHYTNQFDASLIYDGERMSEDYNFAMPPTFNVNRSWGLNHGGNQPDEWNEWPYKDRRLSLSIYSAAAPQPSSTWGFYQRNGGVAATERASAAVRAIDSSGIIDPDGKPAAGWFVINGLAPSTDSGINFVARFAILACLRTFHDTGSPVMAGYTNNKVGANTYRIAPVPLVYITHPKVGKDLSGYSVINLEWKERFARWDGRRYTENYPCLDIDEAPCAAADSTQAGNPDLEWHDTVPLAFNLKYSLNGGQEWFSVLTDSPAKPGVYMEGADSIAQASGHTYTYNWDVSALPTGNKLIRVEAYRVGLGLHYAYHEMALKNFSNPGP